MKRLRVLIALLILSFASIAFADEVKEADLAGSWYPGNKTALMNTLDGYLKTASPEKIDGDIFAIISPHAGYRFSGPVQAYGFKAVEDRAIKTVIVIGFSHRKFYNGISVYARGAFKTPIGEVAIDTHLAEEIISKNNRISFYPGLFTEENSVEIQIPFIQHALKNAKLVPIAFGTQSFDDADILADALAESLKDREGYLIVASTDLSHYHPYEEANSIDRHSIDLLKEMKGKELYDEARLGICELCGVMPVTATLLAAEKLGFDKMKILKYANSGDTLGSRGNVVGYLSAVIYKAKGQRPKTIDQKMEKNREVSMLNEAQRKRLLQIARESITSYVRDGKRKNFAEADPMLNEPMGAFVTLHEKGELRGCIGNMVGQGPLYQTVADMAVEAATGDPRFQGLSAQELEKIDIEISVLSPLKKTLSHEEVKIPGHGVMVRKGLRSGVYLPQVADETGWNKEEFLTSLCGHKAVLPPDAWKDPATEIYVFTAEVFGEKEVVR